jgi:hypothetical protein
MIGALIFMSLVCLGILTLILRVQKVKKKKLLNEFKNDIKDPSEDFLHD